MGSRKRTVVSSQRSTPLSRWLVPGTYGLLSAALAVYAASVLVRHEQYSTAWDGWLVIAIETVASVVCITRARSRPRIATAATCLGFGLLCWAVGDCFLTVESFGGATPSTPSVADAFYLVFYPLTYTCALLLLRSFVGSTSRSNWLDGLVAGCGAAALCSAFLFHGIVHAVGLGPLGTAVDLAYPVGDLTLFGLAIGGLALVPGRAKPVWGMLSLGMIIVAVGDTVNLFSSTIGAAGLGYFINAVAWPAGTLLMSALPSWAHDGHHSRAMGDEAGIWLPVMSGAGALVVVLVASFHNVSRAAVGLAGLTLAIVGLRGLLSVRVLRSLSQERHEQATTDHLTGLRNRRHLLLLLDDFFEARENGTGEMDLAFLFVDLNRFKEVNDSFGHPVGDELLRQLGDRLQATLSSGDVAVRLGGDEFVVLLPSVEPAAAAGTAKRIAEEIGRPYNIGAVDAKVTASIGIAMAGGAADASDLMWRADAAMYRAKQSGAEYFLHNYESAPRLGIQLVDQILAAIDERQLSLHYQPQLDIGTGRICGGEALLRWEHPSRGLVPPAEFLPIAEEAGLMDRITEYVLHEALSQAAEWRRSGRLLTVSVNVSPTSLLQPGFVEYVAKALEQYRVPPGVLVVEITEGIAIRNFDGSRHVIERFARLGVAVSIDDFGAGATSLVYLNELGGIAELKLDRAFLAGAALQPRDLELVRATIQLGHAVGMRVVAEGVEDAETLHQISALGCDMAQGFYIGRPVPPGDFAPGLGLRHGTRELTSA